MEFFIHVFSSFGDMIANVCILQAEPLGVVGLIGKSIPTYLCVDTTFITVVTYVHKLNACVYYMLYTTYISYNILYFFECEIYIFSNKFNDLCFVIKRANKA